MYNNKNQHYLFFYKFFALYCPPIDLIIASYFIAVNYGLIQYTRIAKIALSFKKNNNC